MARRSSLTCLNRRTLLAGLAAALAAPRYGLAAGVMDATGRTITAPDRVMRVYPAGPPAAVELYTLAPDLLIGWLEPIGADALEFLIPDIAARPQIPRLTGSGGDNVNLDALKSFNPDLIVDIGNVDGSYASLAERVQRQSGIPYALLDGHLDRIGSSYRALGALIGRGDRADTLARYAENTIAVVTQRSAAVPSGARPRVYYARDKSGLQTGFGGSMIAEPIEFVGARNVAADLRGAHGATTIEQVRGWDPEIIIASDKEFAEKVRNDPEWASIAAVKTGRIHLSPKQPFGWVDYPPAVNRLIGLWWLAKIFYPDKFPEDIKALARDFYAAFYQVTPSAAQIDRVLAGGA
jgi:iron complex transport system substrate-binding protein